MSSKPPPLEKTIVRHITDGLKATPRCFFFKTLGGHGQRAGLPDLIGVIDGRMFGLEIKRPGLKATPLQAATLVRIRDAGGIGEVVTSWDEAREVLGL